MKRLLTTAVAVPAMALGLFAAAPVTEARADYEPGCEQVLWGFLGSQRRVICDGPVNPVDGGWNRVRVIGTPAGWVSGYCSRYSFYCSPGYYREESIQKRETYYVLPSNVLPDEPGHLPAGVLR